MAFLNSLIASSSQPRSANSMPRELCSSERAMLSFSRAMGPSQSMRRRILGARRCWAGEPSALFAALTLWVSLPASPREAGGQAEAEIQKTDGGLPEANSIVVTFGGDVTLGYHYEEYFDDQLAKGKTREQMLGYG